MAKTVRAVFDGDALRPEVPMDLQPNKSYIISIEGEVPNDTNGDEEPYPLTQIADVAVDMGVTDLSTRHDWYARGRDPHDDRER